MKPLNVFNVRLGLATNSSSSHSIIFTEQRVRDSYDNLEGFGWDFFTLASQQAKESYFQVALYQTLRHTVGKDIARMVAQSFVMEPHHLTESANYLFPYIDHQSAPTIPSDWGGHGIDMEFAQDFYNFLMQDNLVVLGGNDNDGKVHPLAINGAVTLPFANWGSSAAWVARKDHAHNYWTLFSRTSGAKLRFGFNEDMTAPARASVPELVDIKITDYCDHNCPWCYQSSSVDGKHADYIHPITKALGELKVFEVALGGGEPTLHPRFTSILRDFQYCGVVPNFTTHKLAWLRDDSLRQEVLASCGAFAYTPDNIEQARALCSLVDVHEINPRRVSIQLIAGFWEGPVFEKLLSLAHVHNIGVTLLGYKATGRGANYRYQPTRESLDEMWTVILKLRAVYGAPRISIDTVLAEQLKDKLVETEIPHWLYHTSDGTFSYYIDAVSKKIGPSSYCPTYRLIDMSADLTAQIARVF